MATCRCWWARTARHSPSATAPPACASSASAAIYPRPWPTTCSGSGIRTRTTACVRTPLFRLGHSSADKGVLAPEPMARAFTVKHLGRAPARFEESQLNAWQREVAHHMPLEESERWLAAETPRDIDAQRRRAFIAAIRPNVLLPADVAHWREVVFGP